MNIPVLVAPVIVLAVFAGSNHLSLGSTADDFVGILASSPVPRSEVRTLQQRQGLGAGSGTSISSSEASETVNALRGCDYDDCRDRTQAPGNRQQSKRQTPETKTRATYEEIEVAAMTTEEVGRADKGRLSKGAENSADRTKERKTQENVLGVGTDDNDDEAECESTGTCERLYRPGSRCIEGKCTNPFESGCLRRILGKDNYPKRACNSDDGNQNSAAAANADIDDDDTICSQSRFDYMEIRLGPANWESSIFVSWIFQILLSETLEVPVTIETSGAGPLSFYDHDPNAFAFPSQSYNWDAVEEANRVKDCTKTSRNCVHLLPEVWNGQEYMWTQYQSRGDIEPVEGSGAVGELSLYIPKFVAENDDSLVSFYGMSGNDNRDKLAETFKRPTTWLDYCKDVSPTNCTADDEVVTRWPSSDEEEGLYFLRDTYPGHFRATPQNDCVENNSTCTGHIVNGPCGWTTFAEAQLYWNDIALQSDGPESPHGGYSYSSMVQIWEASNATRSPVIMWWWRPQQMIQQFRGGPGEFQPVALPEPNYECTRNRVSDEDRCSNVTEVRMGLEVGSCDYEPQTLQKVVSKSLEEEVKSVPEADRSPSYDALRSIQISELAIEDILDKWMATYGGTGYRAREAVCGWVANNTDILKRYIPAGYPRIVRTSDDQYKRAHLYAAQGVGAFVALVVLAVMVFTYRNRKEKVVVYAQPAFLIMVLCGFFLVSMGAIVYPEEPSKASCVSQQWLVMLGYTLQLVPLLVKVAAMNKLFRESQRMRRIRINTRKLKSMVALVTVFVVTYLVVWTVADPPTRVEERVLVKRDEGIVHSGAKCASSSDVWEMVAHGWNTFLLLSAAILAFQSRSVRQEFNEALSLFVMVYSHFLFLVTILIMHFFSKSVPSSTRAGIESFLLSFDTLTALIIYFGPKVLMIMGIDPHFSTRKLGRRTLRRLSQLSIVSTGSKTDSLAVGVWFQDEQLRARSGNISSSLAAKGGRNDFEAKQKLEKSAEGDGTCGHGSNVRGRGAALGGREVDSFREEKVEVASTCTEVEAISMTAVEPLPRLKEENDTCIAEVKLKRKDEELDRMAKELERMTKELSDRLVALEATEAERDGLRRRLKAVEEIPLAVAKEKGAA